MRYECAVWIGTDIKDGRNEEERGKKKKERSQDGPTNGHLHGLGTKTKIFD